MASAALQNIYYERKVGTAKPCYICRRDTTTVLATIKSEDFVYTCEGHLTDPGFATLIPAPTPPTPSGPSAEDIKKVISDYEARQAKKTATKDKDKEKADEKKPSTPSSSTPIPIASPPSGPPAPTHRKYALHRQIFDMRRNELRKREMGVKAREVGKGLPAVPRGF